MKDIIRQLLALASVGLAAVAGVLIIVSFLDDTAYSIRLLYAGQSVAVLAVLALGLAFYLRE